MNPLSLSEQAYWQEYLNTLPSEVRPMNAHVSAGYAGSPEITDELLALYLAGKKTAGSSILEDFLTAGDPVPAVGNYWIYLSSDGRPACILRTEKVVLNKFRDIPPEIVVAEGEGDLSLRHWKKVHTELYAPHLAAWGLIDIDEATVITEYFEIVYR